MDKALGTLLHPVRWQIVQQLALEPLTPQRMKERMPQVAQATLYRQLQALTDAGLVAVSGQEQVRGAVEKTYVLGPLLAGPSETVEGRRGQAMLVLALLQADIDAALQGEASREGLTLTRTVLHMTAQEHAALQSKLADLLAPLLAPHPDARPYALGLVLAEQTEAGQAPQE